MAEEVPNIDYQRARLESLRKAQYATESFEQFVGRRQPLYMPVPPHLQPLYDLVERSRHEQVNAIISYGPRHGKRLKSSTKILTPAGWKNHGDLRVGDYVYAPDGTATAVTYVSPNGPIDLRFTFDDGQTIDAHNEHLWSVQKAGERFERVLDANDMLESGVIVNGSSGRYARFSISYTKPLDGLDVALPYEPWLFGYWIGNGTTGYTRVTIGPEDSDHITREVMRRGHVVHNRFVHKASGCVSLEISGGPALSAKRIPDLYLIASLSQRRSLVAGLVDSDGHVDRRTGRVRYVTTLPELAEDVMRLVSTLGYRPSVTRQDPHTGFAQGREVIGRLDTYTVQWTPHDGVAPGTLPRKRFAKHGVRRRRSIISIEKLETEDVGQCIQVAHPSHLYLAGERLVSTHNSETVSHAIAWRTLIDPAVQNVYATYNHSHAEEFGAKIRLIAVESGVRVGGMSGSAKVPGSSKVFNWKTSMGGGLLSTSIGGSLTGMPCHGLMVLDDIIKGAEAAASITERERVWRWFISDVLSRIEGGGSIFIVGTRFHEDDPAGRIQEGGPDWAKWLGRKWVVINVPSVGDEFGNPVDERKEPHRARPCWTSINSRYPNNPEAAMEWYRVKRAGGEHEWWALHQGVPRSKNQKVFAEDPAPCWMPIQFQGRRAMLMMDPAATGKTSSDYSALGCFTMRGYGDLVIWGHDKWGEKVEMVNPNPSILTAVEIWKDKIPVPDAVEEAYRWQQRYGFLLGIEVDGTGANLPDWIRKLQPKLRITEVRTGGKDKYTRAQPAAKAWNTSRIEVPNQDDEGFILDQYGKPYIMPDGGRFKWQCPPREYIRVIKSFTGVGDREDDVVDITSAAWNRMFRPWSDGSARQIRAPAY